jgi:F0F1-type ATP synthase assembly protein I
MESSSLGGVSNRSRCARESVEPLLSLELLIALCGRFGLLLSVVVFSSGEEFLLGGSLDLSCDILFPFLFLFFRKHKRRDYWLVVVMAIGSRYYQHDCLNE